MRQLNACRPTASRPLRGTGYEAHSAAAASRQPLGRLARMV